MKIPNLFNRNRIFTIILSLISLLAWGNGPVSVIDITSKSDSARSTYPIEANFLLNPTFKVHFYALGNFAPCFSEDFTAYTAGGNTSTSGTNQPDSNDIFGVGFPTATVPGPNFPAGSRAYQAGGAVKLGTASLAGSLTSRNFGNSGNQDITLSFDVKGWTTVEGDIYVTMNGVTKTITYTNTLSAGFANKSVTFLNVPVANTFFTIGTTAKRAFLDNIVANCTPVDPRPELAVFGNSVQILDGDNTPSTTDDTDFGTVPQSNNVVKTYTLKNNGSQPLVLTNPAVLTLDGSKGFTVSQPSSLSLAPGATTTFDVTFNKTPNGIYRETIMIGSNSNNSSSTFTFDVKAVVSSPIVSVTPMSLSGMDYNFGQGPSGLQNFKLSGSNLTGNITLTAPLDGNFEIARNSTYNGTDPSPWQSITLTKTAGNTVSNTTVYVRLKVGLGVGTYTGNITVSTPGLTDQLVYVTGTVNEGIVDMKVYGIIGSNPIIPNGSNSPQGLNNTLFGTVGIGLSQSKQFQIQNLGGAPLNLGDLEFTTGDISEFSFTLLPSVTVLNQNETADFEITFKPTSIGVKNTKISITNNDLDDDPYTFTVQGTGQFCAPTGINILAVQDFEDVPAIPTLGYLTSDSGTVGIGTGRIAGQSTNSDKPSKNNFYTSKTHGYTIKGNDIQGIIPSSRSFIFNDINTIGYSNISLSVNVAGFSIGSKTNGMDCNAPDGQECGPIEQRVDYVLIEVSPDGGDTWYEQAKILSGEMNVAWSFGSSGTISKARDYKADSNLSYFESLATSPIKNATINNLPETNQLKIRITAQCNSTKEAWVLDDIKVVSNGLNPKIWNGSAWSPNSPTINDKAIIDGDYASTSAGFSACQCEVKSGHTLTVDKAHTITVLDKLTNNGNIIVKSDANFLQTVNPDTNENTGTFTVERTASLKRLDYNYWSSPVIGQNLKAFSPNTLNIRFLTYNQSTDLFEPVPDPVNTVFDDNGKGYAIRAPNNYPATLQDFSGVFKGVPNNGTKGFDLAFTPGRGYNLIGNPYPSNIDFYKLWSNNSSLITKTAYFWTNLNPNPIMQGENYPNGGYLNNYATLNGTGGIPATSVTSQTSLTPTRYIKVGQGFLVRAKTGADAQMLTFDNSIRADGISNFFNKSDIPEDRYWLQLQTPLNVVTTLLVGYMEDASDDFDEDYDAKLFTLGSDAFYSELNGEKLGIQGRKYPLNTANKVDLGASFYAAGSYTIKLADKEGIFVSGQNIYLIDKQNASITNLSEGNYTFQANAGESSGRFEIIYKPQTVLTTNGTVKENLVVYRDGYDMVVRNNTQNIDLLQIFDASGRLILTKTGSQKEWRFPAAALNQGIFIIRATLRSSEVITRKIRN